MKRHVFSKYRSAENELAREYKSCHKFKRQSQNTRMYIFSRYTFYNSILFFFILRGRGYFVEEKFMFSLMLGILLDFEFSSIIELLIQYHKHINFRNHICLNTSSYCWLSTPKTNRHITTPHVSKHYLSLFFSLFTMTPTNT